MEPISIVLIISVELKLLGPLFSIAWRLYFDNEFSNMLKKCMNTLDVLKKCNSEVVLKAKIFWTCIVFILIHSMSCVAVVLGFSNTPDYSVLEWVIFFFFSFQRKKFTPLHFQQHIFILTTNYNFILGCMDMHLLI